jgi:hypothetical protein
MSQGRATKRRRTLRVELLEARELLAANVISGFVFHDTNHDGLFQPTESPLAGSTIELHNSVGTVIGTTTAAADGSYSFTVDQSVNPAPQTQTQSITFPDALTPASRTGTVAQFDSNLGTLTSVDIISMASVTDQIRTENQDAAPHTLVGTVSGTVTTTGPGVSGLIVNTTDTVSFNASAFDGTIDFAGTSGHDFGLRTQTQTQTQTITNPASLAAYTGTGNVTFTQATDSLSGVSGSGNVINSISTTAGGMVTVVYHYTPSLMIQPGNYTIVQTKEPVGYTNGLNSSNGVVLTATPGNNTIPVTVTTATTMYPNNDFGENQFPSSLAGSVFFDANNDGVRESKEFGLANVTVYLTGTDNLGAPVFQVATTDTFGNYHFTSLQPGTYALTEVHPAIFIKGKDHIGTLGGTRTPGKFSSITVPADANGVAYDFGERAKPGCKLLGLTQYHINPGHKLAPSQIGPEIRFYLPSLVPLITAGGTATMTNVPLVGHHVPTATVARKVTTAARHKV